MDRSCKGALLVARDFNDYEFLETVSRNHGQLVEMFADSSQTRIFLDIAEARVARPADRRTGVRRPRFVSHSLNLCPTKARETAQWRSLGRTAPGCGGT